MAETNGAKIIPGPGVRTPNAVRDEAILQDLARGVKAAELAEKHGVSIQRIYNLKSENRDRVAQLQVAEIEVMPILKHQTFADLWIMKPAARMAGFSEIGQVALRKFLELNAASYVYDPESGQPVATRLNRHDVAAMKVFADMYSKAVRDAVELSGEMPARLGERFVLRTIKKHQDPPPPKSEEELAAEEAEQEREARYQAEREARVAARMRQQYPFLFPLSEAENARRNELFDAQYDAEAASLRANGMALTEEEKAERLAYLEGLGMTCWMVVTWRGWSICRAGSMPMMTSTTLCRARLILILRSSPPPNRLLPHQCGMRRRTVLWRRLRPRCVAIWRWSSMPELEICRVGE